MFVEIETRTDFLVDFTNSDRFLRKTCRKQAAALQTRFVEDLFLHSQKPSFVGLKTFRCHFSGLAPNIHSESDLNVGGAKGPYAATWSFLLLYKGFSLKRAQQPSKPPIGFE